MLTLEEAEWAADFLTLDLNAVVAGDHSSGDGQSIGAGASDATGTDDQSGNAGAQADPMSATVADPAAAAPDAATGSEAAASPGAEDKVGVVPIIPIVIVGLKTLTGELTASVSISNNTNFTLTLDTSSLKMTSGDFKTGRPKPVLKPGDPPSTFVVHSTPLIDIPILPNVSFEHAEGTIRYFVGDQKTVWACHFNNPRFITDPLGTNSADATVVGPNAAGLQTPPAANATHGSDGTFTFSLDGKGGDGPSPSNGGGVACSCRVSVVNQTQQTVFLRNQSNSAGGDFVTNPATSLAPGASTQFVYAETPNTNDHRCRGTLSWDIGDPKQGSWGLMWDNQKGAKNLSASFLDPKDGPFHTLDQIDQGDENVPVTFTLSGGGKDGPKPGAKPTSCAIMVKNATQGVVTLTGSTAESGAFQTKPPASIAAGDSALVTFVGPQDDPGKGAAGSMSWDVGDPKAAAWTTSWTNPPGDKNSADGKIDPANAGFKSDAATADGDDDVAMSFTVSGGDQPVKPPVEDNFAPPPKSKQPTLRVGDNSPDGWVEYAQTLLQRIYPNQPIDGNFSPAMKAIVVDFQTNHQCQPDGVIGNETWSVLRDGPKEAVGTDNRAPHSFEQTNAQARFMKEDPEWTGYVAKEDFYFMWVVSTGEQPIDKYHATLKVTQPDKTSHTHKIEIGKVVKPSPDGQGNLYAVEYGSFRETFQLADGVEPTACTVDAYLDEDIGGDAWGGPIVERSRG